MRKYSIVQRVAAAGIAMILSQACKKLVSVPGNVTGQIVTSQVFTDSANATEGVIGLYGGSGPLTSFNVDVFTGLGADELLSNFAYNTAAIAFYKDSLTAGITNGSNSITPSASPFWGFYGSYAIYQANAALGALAADNQLSTPLRNQLMGECKFMRSFYYFYLVNMFGNVPYVTSTDYRVTQRMPRIAAGTVYDSLEQDLLQARQLMLPAYPSAGRQRPNRYTADALLARIYLYRKQWGKAEA